jgi:hypothetical protein
MQFLEHQLRSLPDGALLKSVSAIPATVAGVQALRVTLTDETTAGTPNVDFIDMPTFALLPVQFRNGTLSVDILSRLRVDAPDFARAFAGLAYRVVGEGDQFECVYLRPMNGRKLNPPSPRDGRAIQYFAFPDWKFDRLRIEHPDGPFEAGADIGPDEWIHLKIDVDGNKVEVTVNGKVALTVTEAKATPLVGAVGLWVDIGTEAYFSNISITAR